jgi:hypothetical protein
MATPPRLAPEQIAQVSGLVSQYRTLQCERYAPRAVPLSAQEKAAIAGFFLQQLLDNARLLVLQGERVANPDFYPMLKGLGFKMTSLEWERSRSAMSWSPMNRSTTVSCFTNSSM